MILLSITDMGASTEVPKKKVTAATTTGAGHNSITAYDVRKALEYAKNSNLVVGTKVRVLSTGNEYIILGTNADEAYKSRGSYRIQGKLTSLAGSAEGYNITCLVIGHPGRPMASLYAPGELEIVQ